MSDPEHDSSDFDVSPVGQDFHTWYAVNLRQGIRGPRAEASGESRDFLPYTSVQDYFKDRARVRALLKALFPRDVLQESLEDIQSNYQSVFTILLRIGHGRFIRHFVKYSHLRDECLPFETCPANFPQVSVADSDFFDRFKRAQWTLCPAKFSKMRNTKVFGTNRILPILSRSRISSGGSAVVDKIEIDPAYNFLIEPAQHRHVSPSVSALCCLQLLTGITLG